MAAAPGIPGIKVKKLRPEARLPAYMTAGAAGADLYAAVVAPVRIAAGERTVIPIGIALEIPEGFEGQVRPRSGLAVRDGLTVLNAPGTIDSDYRGELGIVLVNHGSEPFVVEPLSRIAQLVIAPVVQAQIEEVEALSDTTRGQGGFGHTGR